MQICGQYATYVFTESVNLFDVSCAGICVSWSGRQTSASIINHNVYFGLIGQCLLSTILCDCGTQNFDILGHSSWVLQGDHAQFTFLRCKANSVLSLFHHLSSIRMSNEKTEEIYKIFKMFHLWANTCDWREVTFHEAASRVYSWRIRRDVVMRHDTYIADVNVHVVVCRCAHHVVIFTFVCGELMWGDCQAI